MPGFPKHAVAFGICHSGSAFAVPAMHQNWRLGRALLHVVADKVAKVDEQVGGVRDAVVRPGGEVELPQSMALARLDLKTNQRGETQRERLPADSQWPGGVRQSLNTRPAPGRSGHYQNLELLMWTTAGGVPARDLACLSCHWQVPCTDEGQRFREKGPGCPTTHHQCGRAPVSVL